MTQPHLTSNAGASFMQKPKNIDMDDETKKISEMICPQIITLATNIVNEKTKTNNFKTWFCNLKKKQEES